MLAITLFIIVAGRIIIGITFDLFLALDGGGSYVFMSRFAAPSGAVAGLAVVIVFALMRFVVLMRHRVPYGHCPHCGDKIEADTRQCAACNGVIRKSVDAHEKRSRQRGLFRSAIVLAAWVFLILWAASFNLNASLESNRFAGGEGFAILMDTADIRFAWRTPVMADGTATPPGMVADMIDAAHLDRKQYDVDFIGMGVTNGWWIRRDDDRPYPARYALIYNSTPDPEAVERIVEKYNVAFADYEYVDHVVIVPLWIPAAFFFIVAMLMRFRDRAFPPGCCQTCGYDLDSVAGHACPECGTPKVESTYGIPTRWRRRR